MLLAGVTGLGLEARTASAHRQDAIDYPPRHKSPNNLGSVHLCAVLPSDIELYFEALYSNASACLGAGRRRLRSAGQAGRAVDRVLPEPCGRRDRRRQSWHRDWMFFAFDFSQRTGFRIELCHRDSPVQNDSGHYHGVVLCCSHECGQYRGRRWRATTVGQPLLWPTSMPAC